MPSEQQVRLVFLGEAGSALRATETVTTGVKKLSQSEKELAATQKTVRAETAATRREVQGLERDLGKTARGALAGSGAFRSLGRSVAFASGTFLGGYGLATVIRASIDEMQSMAKANAQVSAALRSTGGTAGVTAKQIDLLSQSLLRKTGVDDEVVKSAAAVLLGFTQVRNEAGKGNDVFNRTLVLARDLSIRLGSDLESAVRQLGRALQDPTIGLTALTRSGVAFTSQQREQIKALAESGQLLQAQTLILDEVQRKVGGAAAAFGRTPAGQLAIFQESLKNLAGTYATLLTPEIEDATKAAQKWVDHLQSDKHAQQEFRDDINGIVDAVKEAARVLKTLTDAVGGFKNALELLLSLKIARWASGVLGSIDSLIGTAGAGAAAEGATGLAGASVAAKLLQSRLIALGQIGAISIAVELIIHRKWIGQSLSDLVGGGTLGRILKSGTDKGLIDLLFGGGGGKTSPGSAAQNPASPTTAIRGKGVQLPTFISATHQTAGLTGFPAVDIMAKPGTPIRAPEDGVITRISGHEPSQAPPQGQGGPWGLSIYFIGSETGNTYYMTHLVKVAGLGAYRKGDVIGLIGDYPGSSADHVHFAIHSGKSSEALLPSGLFSPSDFLGSSGSGRSARRGGGSGASRLQNLQLALSQAGTTGGTADDKRALQALIGYYRGVLKNPNLPITTRISDLDILGGYLDQLDSLNPAAKKAKKPTGVASKSSLLTIKNTLAEVSKLVDQAGLSKKFGGELDKINDQLDHKLVKTETVTRVRLQLGKIADAAKAAMDKAKQAVEAKRQAFTDAWTKLADDALSAFDKETADHVGPTRALLNSLIGEHDKAQIDAAVTDAKKALDEALAGKNAEDDSSILSHVRQLVGNSVLANAIDKAQSAILGGEHVSLSSDSLLAQMQQILGGQGGAIVDPQAVADAQKAYDEALYQQKVYYLGLQADAEDGAYQDGRERLRSALETNLNYWGTYYANIGKGAKDAADLFDQIWQATLSKYPFFYGGTQGPAPVPSGGGGGAENFAPLPGGGYAYVGADNGVVGALQAAQSIALATGRGVAFAEGGDRLALSPTLILAGERGPERVSVRPVSQSGMAYAGAAGGGGTHHIQVDLGPLNDLVDSRVMQLTPDISLAIGREASRRARSGRYS